MDGYTVEEAATVLGVPRERVWELLARGILSGSTDLAGGMRVRLKADPAPPAPSPEPAPRSGNGSPSTSSELTPFRELLTEFRSLTERYGQALLALGEARGEVAALRSRVDSLEARVDLRLPPGSARPSGWAPGAVAWPDASERIVAPASEADHVDDERAAAGRRRGKGGRRATEAFAEALARANDPSPSELPGAQEAAAALAAYRESTAEREALHDVERSGDVRADPDVEAALPRVGPPAQAMARVPDEPDDAAARGSHMPERPAPPPPMEPEPEPAPPAPEPQPDAAAASVATQIEPVSVTGEAAEPAPTWDRERYTTEIGEPDWLSVEDVPAAAAESVAVPAAERVAEEGLPSPPTSEPEAEQEYDPDRESEIEPDAEPAPGREPELEADTEQPDREQQREPDPERERERERERDAVASRELDEAIAALDALANPPASEPAAPPVALPERAQAPYSRPAVARPIAVTRSPASRAYRRLRRIFPS